MTSFKKQRKWGEGVKPDYPDYPLQLTCSTPKKTGKTKMNHWMNQMKQITLLTTKKNVHTDLSNQGNKVHPYLHVGYVKKIIHTSLSNQGYLYNARTHKEGGK